MSTQRLIVIAALSGVVGSICAGLTVLMIERGLGHRIEWLH